jgi:hypothetical protein
MNFWKKVGIKIENLEELKFEKIFKRTKNKIQCI